MITKESIIQEQIKKHLSAKGYLVVKIIQSTLNGWPDLQAMKEGKIIFIEVKKPGTDLVPLQKYRRRQIKDHGFVHITAWGVEDIKHL